MENLPIVELFAWKFSNPEDHKNFGKWATEVFYPMYMRSPHISGIDRYRIIKEEPGYCSYISIFLYPNYKAWINHSKSKEWKSIMNDMLATWGNKRDVIWGYFYQPERSFHSPAFTSALANSLKSGDAPCIHIEAPDLMPEKEGDYYSWFTDIGNEVFISRITDRPGIIGYDHLKFLNVNFDYFELEGMNPQERVSPAYVSIFYFDNFQHCQSFTRSRELAAFRAGMSPYFPEELKLKWNIDYELIASWRNEKAST
jgi:hypothetical protein